jgi:glycine cleavage system H protein
MDHTRIGWWRMGGLYLHGLGSRNPRSVRFLQVFLPVLADSEESFGVWEKVLESTVSEVTVPSQLRYSKDHEWVLLDGSRARVGITDYAQDALGDIVFIQLPTFGSTITLHDGIGEIESTKSVNDVYAPVTGVIIAVNEALIATPELLNTDPYGSGWICDVEVSNANDIDLLSADEYSALIGAV